MNNIKFLVTGGAGFIGSNTVEYLLKREHFVLVLDNFATGKRENLKEFEKDIELIEGNILAATKENIESGLVMNCACHGQITLTELVVQINKLLNKDIKPFYAEPRHGGY